MSMEPVAWMHDVKEPDGNECELLSRSPDNPYSHWVEKHRDKCTYTATPLVRLSDAEARIAEAKAADAFTLSDGSRMLQKSDVQDVCPHPDDCFYYGDRVRCGPCAVKASAAKGIAIDDTHSHLPEVCRLRRELKAAEALLKEAGKALEPFSEMAGVLFAANKNVSDPIYGFGKQEDMQVLYGKDFFAARSMVAKIARER